MSVNPLLVVLFPALTALLAFFLIKYQVRVSRQTKELEALNKDLEAKKRVIGSMESTMSQYRSEMEPLRKYQIIQDADLEAATIISNASQTLEAAKADYELKIAEANALSKSELSDAREKAKAIREKAESSLADAHSIASKIELDAVTKAKEIAGDAWEAKQNADQYQATVTAMKNIIKGYGDEYLVPNQDVLDELAGEFDHEEAGAELKRVRLQIQSMIKNTEAADCDYKEAYRKETAIEFVLDAFNGKVDTILSKVKHDNYGKLSQQLTDAFRIVNHNGKPFKNARITDRYFDVTDRQLKMAVAVHELKRQDMAEQKEIRDAMREEERARREYEKALKAAEKEEKLLNKAMRDAEAKLAGAAAEEREKYEQMLDDLKLKLADAEASGQRALSMAQQTKQGHVYVISNVGSFGENVFKIGMTRRLEPLDRVKELGDASVPFSFDVHAMIHSEDAPKLEKLLHHQFDGSQVNKVNPRKEFFNVGLSDIKSTIDSMDIEAHWTMKAAAEEYRESVQLAKKQQAASKEKTPEMATAE